MLLRSPWSRLACLGLVFPLTGFGMLAACSSAADSSMQSADLSNTTKRNDAGDAGTGAGDGGTAEARTAAHLTAIESNATELASFLAGVPKGGDLHHHLSGAVYAETYLGWAATAKDCLETATGDYYLSIDDGCSYAGDVAIPASAAALYTQTVEAMSMLNFVASSTETGHDHFFATFDKYGEMSGTAHHGVSLADVSTRAASENELYIEPMLTSNGAAEDLGTSTWTADHGTATMTEADFATFRTQLLAASTWSTAVSAISSDIATTEATSEATLGCSGTAPPAACAVTMRYQEYISRSGAAPAVFAQMVAAYEAAVTEPKLKALNLVGPEDGTTALENYDLQMSMLQYLNGAYAGKSPLRLALHAGELAAAYMPAGYTIGTVDHVQKAVEIAGAARIGHGVDIESEGNAATTLGELAAKKILVEINLSSNTQILGISGTAHPLAKYLAAGVPVALSTDDQGVSRSSMAGEYVRAVTDQKLGYVQLKALSRNSLEYSFLEGDSLYTDFGSLTPTAACADASDTTTTGSPSAACQTFLTANPRAGLEWELERRYRVFESQF
jgi:adenosine deaminase